jgi:acyl-CoA synthetase (AMP-forming)/AMP-acid ligase II
MPDNNTEETDVADKSLSDVVRRWARDTPDNIAYETVTRKWTFAEFDRESSRIAQGLAALGIGAGDRVACLTKHIAECTLLAVAAIKVGAVCCPVNWRLAPPEIEYVVNHAEARFLMVDADFLPQLDDVAFSSLRKTVTTDRVTTDRAAESGRSGKIDTIFTWSGQFDARDSHYVPERNETALQLYSSGTTGHPKGVELTHRNMLSASEAVGKEFGYHEGPSITFNALPTFHIGGFGLSMLALYNGGTTVAYPDFDPPRIVAGFGKHKITHTFMVPAMIHLLLQVPGVEDADFSTLKLIGYGASPITEKVLLDALRVFKCKFVQNYGLTETNGTIVVLPPEDHDPNGPRAYLLRAAGKPLQGVDLRIVDTATGQTLPDGEVGEVWIRSEKNMRGYWRNDKATAEAFPEGREDYIGWFRSGDAGYLKDGYLYIQDRVKDMIISGGENIYPIEVENVLAMHPAVSDCAVIAVPDEKWGESVKACVVTKPGAQVSAEELIAYTRARLAHYKCPKSVDFMDVMPRNPTGKILKKFLREPYWKGIDRKVN